MFRTFFNVLIFFILFAVSTATAQEFNCTVTVNTRQISNTSYEYVNELERQLEQYINQNRWTEDRFEEHERIQCNFQIVLTSVDDNSNFSAEAFFTVRRPIYNTFQSTTTIVITDSDWRFNYPRNKSLILDQLQFDDLTSFVDFYLYIILGYDYDSFSERGGTRYFNIAQNIFELGQNSSAPGWGRSIGAQRNRFGLISDITNPSYGDLREAFYRYHRHGLDQFTLNPDIAVSETIDALKLMQENKRLTSNNYLFDLFFDTKFTEIVAMLQSADIQDKLEAYNVLRDVDPAHSSEYEKLQN